MFISLDHLGKDFRKKPRALDDLTLDLPSGMIGLVGPNGAGKTTLMRILCGIASPTRGRVLVDGCDLADARVRRALKRTLGYLPQDIEPYPNLTPPEFLDYVGVLKGMDDARERRRQAAELLERVGLADVARRRIGGFSGGMRRRVGIAQALMGDPRLLVVDEPTAGLDPEERMRFRTLLATLGGERTVILSTHILDDVAQTCPYAVSYTHLDVYKRQAEVTYPRPLEDLLEAAFERYCQEVPWARDFELSPKSVVRDMVETASDFKTYVQRYKIARSEGTLLRYLADACRVLDRTVPSDRRDERLEDIVSWLGFLVRSVDSSLVDEWESAGSVTDAAPPSADDAVVADRRGLMVLVRNALFSRVRLAALGRADELGRLDQEWGCGEPRWQRALDAYYEAHELSLIHI